MDQQEIQFFNDINAENGLAVYGPRQLQIDITNNCNTNCIGCWCHSAYLGDKKLSAAEKKIALSYDTVCRVVDDAAALKVAKIQLAGSGDPLVHPDFAKIVAYIKSRNLQLEVLTNGIALTEEIIDVLVKTKVDDIVISMWAGSPKMYQRIHPNQPESTFHSIVRMLKRLREAKACYGGLPIVRMYHVITSVNYSEIQAMVECAYHACAEKVEFQIIDIVAGKTEFLELSWSHIRQIEKQFSTHSKWNNFMYVERYNTEEFSELGRMLYPNKTKEQFRYFFIDARFYTAICPVGLPSYKHLENLQYGHYDFFFDGEACRECIRFDECSIDKKGFFKRIHFLSIVGVQTFLRRIAASKEKKERLADPQIEHMPCYAGWDYSRIMTNGDVIPCCKGHLNPIGNLYESSFKAIWDSKKYTCFRLNAKKLAKSDVYFKNFGCLQGCDNYGRNAQIARQLRAVKMKGKI